MAVPKQLSETAREIWATEQTYSLALQSQNDRQTQIRLYLIFVADLPHLHICRWLKLPPIDIPFSWEESMPSAYCVGDL